MYGSNYYGQSYYGQGPAVGTTFIFHAVSGTAVTSATISFVLLVNKIVSATVTTTASIGRQFVRILSAVVTVTATATSAIFEALNIRNTTTRSLNLKRTTMATEGFDNETEALNLDKRSRKLTI